MSASFGKRLKREVTANPKKAAALGALFVVAIWFWAPLLKGWLAPDMNVPAVPSGASVPGQAAPANPGQLAVSSKPLPAAASATSLAGTAGELPKAFAGGYCWQQIAEAIETDPRMKPAVSITSRTNVFAAPPPPVAATEAPTEPVAEQPSIKFSPSEAGLVLSSTIVGPKRRMALINGRRYSVGDEIKSTKEGQKIVFKLVAVDPRQIVLENDGDQFLVKMPGAKLANDDDLQ